MKKIDKILDEFDKEFSEPCDGVHKGICKGKKVDEYTVTLQAFLKTTLEQFEKEIRREIVDSVPDECVDCDLGEWHTCGIDIDKIQQWKEELKQKTK